MSRCFPFPPPGCENKYVVPKEPLIESIKLQRKREQSKKERREKKRERKEKKEKTVKASIEENYNSQKKRWKDEECYADFRGGAQKNIEDEGENIERSGLSEEHGQPAYVLNLCDSSDSTQSSGKKQKHGLSDGNHKQSTVLRFRLPLLKLKGLEASPSGEEHCSTSGSVEVIPHDKGDTAPRLLKEHSWPISKRIEIVDHDVAEPAATSSCIGSGSSDKDVQLKDLIDNWVPPPIQIESSDFDDQEWLFGVPRRREVKRERAINGASPKSCSKASDGVINGSFSCWSRACYLAEADIYALPYTVPY